MAIKAKHLATLLILGTPLEAAAKDALVVHITCTHATKATINGSGVLISDKGHVLTAKHVVLTDYTCMGAIGSIDAAKNPLDPISQSFKYDGMVLKLDAKTPEYARYCEMDTHMKAREILVYGYHRASPGEPSVTDGIISTVTIQQDGSFETSAGTISGKSGGPAFLKGSTNIIGIVKDGRYDPATGDAIAYHVTAAEILADIAPLKKAENCAPTINGYTVEQHQAILEKRLTELRADLERASTAEKENLRLKLDATGRDLSDLQASFERREEELRLLRLQLAELDNGQIASDKLEAAQKALFRGDTALADAVFAEVEDADAQAVIRVAAAAFGRGKIAEDDIRWADAATHYAKAARLDPSYDHLRSAREFTWRSGDYTNALQYGSDLIETAKTEFGQDTPEHATALNEHALTLKTTGRYAEAEPLYREDMRITGITLGKEHPDYATSLNNLAGLLITAGRHKEAEPLFREAMRIREIALGKEHSDYAQSLNNLAELLRTTGRHAEAEPLYREAMRIDEITLGKEHPDYAIDLNNLAGLLKTTGRYAEAEPLYREAVRIGKVTLGKEHPDYATRLNNLAALLQDTGRVEEAEPLYREAMRITGNALGKKHPDYAIDLNNLAVLLYKTDRSEEAAVLLREAVMIVETSFGPDHPTTQLYKANLDFLIETMKKP